MNNVGRSGLNGVFLVLLGFLLGILGISGYTSASGWKGTWHNLLSLTGQKSSNTQLASASCRLDPKSQDDQIFFISCGGIY